MKRLFLAALLAVSSLVHAQSTTVNLSPFTPDQCEAAKSKLADSTLKCAATFTPAPIVPTLTLSGLPDLKTTATSASITATVTPAAQVWCRLDNWAPIACPQTFSLGAVTPLAAGQHKVDYYVGSTFDVAKPTRTYTWTITSIAPPPPPPATALAALTGGSSTISNTASVVAVPDPNGSGRSVNLHTISSGGNLIYGGVRAELTFPNTKLIPGHDYWMSFAINQKAPGINGPTNIDDEMLVMQTHTPAQGATTPDLSINLRGQDAKMRFFVAYNTKPSNTWNYVGGPNKDTESALPLATDALPVAGKWTRYVIHYRPGFTNAHAPRTRLWRANAGGDYALLLDSTSFNTYNSLDGPSYPRIGPYKWSDSAWKFSPQAFYMTPLYFGEGADLLEAGKASVASFQ